MSALFGALGLKVLTESSINRDTLVTAVEGLGRPTMQGEVRKSLVVSATLLSRPDSQGAASLERSVVLLAVGGEITRLGLQGLIHRPRLHGSGARFMQQRLAHGEVQPESQATGSAFAFASLCADSMEVTVAYCTDATLQK